MKPRVVHFYFAISGTLFDAIDKSIAYTEDGTHRQTMEPARALNSIP